MILTVTICFLLVYSCLVPSAIQAKNNKAINKVAIAYTSASTALNQKLSEKVKANEPIKELPSITIALFFEIGSLEPS